MKRKALVKRSGGLSSVTCSGKPADLASKPSGVDSIPSKARTIRKSCTSLSTLLRTVDKSDGDMGEFVEHLKRKADSAGCEVIELNAYELKMSQYDPQTDTYRKKPLKERWHRWGNTGTLVQRDAMSAFLACHATEKGHDRALLLKKWTTAEALLSGSGLCRHEPRSDPEVSRDASGLTKPDCGSNAEREYMVSSPFASVRGIFGVQLPLEGASMRVLHSIRGEATPLNLAFRGFVWVIPCAESNRQTVVE